MPHAALRRIVLEPEIKPSPARSYGFSSLYAALNREAWRLADEYSQDGFLVGFAQGSSGLAEGAISAFPITCTPLRSYSGLD